MNTLKKIGIAGYGKMGKDIFELLHSKLTDSEFVIYVRHDAEAETEKINKNLSKALRRKKITEESFEKMSRNFLFTSDLNMFSDCTLVIETITENPEDKQKLFAELEQITDSDCVYASNTSSIRLSDIFSVCSEGRKTMGLHFFYPVKLSGFIELNDCGDLQTAKAIASLTGKETVSFTGDYCFYLNQFISYCISHAFILAEKYNTGVKSAMTVLEEIFPLHSLFGMVDSIGLGLLTAGDNSSCVERIKPVLDYGRSVMNSYLTEGCSPESGSFVNFINEKEADTAFSETDSENFPVQMLSAVINEAVIASSENDGDVISALYDTIGLADTFSSYYSRYGYTAISENLAKIQALTGYSCYAVTDKKQMEDILIKNGI